MRGKIGGFLIILGLVMTIIFLGKSAQDNEKHLGRSSVLFLGGIATMLTGLGVAAFPRINIK